MRTDRTKRQGALPRLARALGTTDSSGFTLIEVLVSMAMVGIVVGSFTSTLSFTANMARHQEMTTRAVAVADTVTEGLLMMSSSDTNLELGTHTQQYTRGGLPAGGEEGKFTVQWEVSSHETVTGIKQIEVEVSWQEGARYNALRWTTYRT